MPRYIPITDQLCLVEQKVETKKVVTKKGPVSHVWIYDRSGSMTYYLPDLCNQLISLSKNLPKGDVLSLGWFSSEGGEFNWVFKGFRIVDNADYKALEQAIKKNSSSIGCTCFSEILNDTDTVIKDLSVLSRTFALNFFTDGYPVVSDYDREIKNIFSAIKKIRGNIQSSSLIGFGSFYNRSLMSDMSDNLGSVLIHSSEIQEFSKHILKLVDMSQNSEPKIEIPCLINNPTAIFMMTPDGIVNLTLEEKTIFVNPQKESVFLYYVSQEQPDKKSWTRIDPKGINFGDSSDPLAQAMYAAALVTSQKAKTDLSLDILGKIGDVALIDSLNNSFLTEEYGNAEQKINSAIYDVSQRFSSGRKENYVPAPNCFCIYDALTALIDDDQSSFYPYKMDYQRTGTASIIKEGFGKFIPDKENKCPFNTMVMHENRLNLSLQTQIKGTVDLQIIDGKGPSDFGFSNPYPVYVFRNFTFIKDGHLHTKNALISTSNTTYQLFKNKGLIIQDNFKDKNEYLIDLSGLPVINRQLANGKLSGTELAQDILEEQKLKGIIKSLKWLRDQECPEEKIIPSALSEAQSQFLTANGIKVDRGGLYDPQTTREEPVDWYQAGTFEIKLAGLSSLPAVKKVMEKMASNKTRTPVETLIETGIVQWEKAKGSLRTATDKKAWFDKEIRAYQDILKVLRIKVQSCKFAVLLSKRWFQEFNSRENCEILINGVKCSFILSEEKVGY